MPAMQLFAPSMAKRMALPAPLILVRAKPSLSTRNSHRAFPSNKCCGVVVARKDGAKPPSRCVTMTSETVTRDLPRFADSTALTLKFYVPLTVEAELYRTHEGDVQTLRKYPDV